MKEDYLKARERFASAIAEVHEDAQIADDRDGFNLWPNGSVTWGIECHDFSASSDSENLETAILDACSVLRAGLRLDDALELALRDLELALRDRREVLTTLALAQERGTALHNELTALKASARQRLAQAREAFIANIQERAPADEIVEIEDAFDDALSTLQPIPDHIKCIGHPESPDHRSLCGKDDGVPSFRFTDVNHALGAVESGSRLTPCGECLAREMLERRP